jgi:type IV secretion system protein VirB4
MNFLVSESMKYNPKLFLFDMQRGSELFIRALGGSYKRIMKDVRSNQLMFNPLKIPDSPENREFLKQWLYDLMMDEKYQLEDIYKDQLEAAIDYNYSLPEGERKLSAIASKFWPLTEPIVVEKPKEKEKKQDIELLLKAAAKDYEEDDEVDPLPETPEGRLSFWYGEGKFAHFFDNDEDGLDLTNRVSGFDVTEIVQEVWPVIPVVSYMLHRITQSLDGSPTIIVLDEAWRLIDNPIFAPRITEWLDELTKKNAMVIFATESVDDASNSSITHDLIEKMATLILLPNDNATEAYKEVFGLSDKEYEMLNSMKLKERHFLLRHHGDAVVARLNLAGMYDIIGILSGTRENIALVESIILEVGDKPANWLPVFKERLKK